MASNQTFSDKVPPPLNRATTDYTKWKKQFKIWQQVTDVNVKKQAGMMILRLDDGTQDSIMELMTHDQMKEDNGADLLIGHLDTLFKKDESVDAYRIYEEFESYRRSSNISIAEHCREFQKRLSKVAASGTQLSDHVLAYRLLKSANLTDREEQLVKATIPKMTHADMAEQLQKVFASSTGITKGYTGGIRIKEEVEDELENETVWIQI